MDCDGYLCTGQVFGASVYSSILGACMVLYCVGELFIKEVSFLRVVCSRFVAELDGHIRGIFGLFFAEGTDGLP